MATKTTSACSTITLSQLKPSDVPAFIGRGASFLNKKVKTPSWKMFEKWMKDEKIESQENHVLQVRIFISRGDNELTQSSTPEEGDVVKCNISSSSEELMKFALYNVNKAQSNFNIRLRTHFFHTSMDHSMIPILIGRGGSVISKIRNETCEELDGIEAIKTRITINQHQYIGGEYPEDIKEATIAYEERVHSNTSCSFLGWSPEEDVQEEFVEIKVTSYAKIEDFNSLIVSLEDALQEKINGIKSQKERFEKKQTHYANEMKSALDTHY